MTHLRTVFRQEHCVRHFRPRWHRPPQSGAPLRRQSAPLRRQSAPPAGHRYLIPARPLRQRLMAPFALNPHGRQVGNAVRAGILASGRGAHVDF